jgi:hypothetical protein
MYLLFRTEELSKLCRVYFVETLVHNPQTTIGLYTCIRLHKNSVYEIHEVAHYSNSDYACGDLW